MAPSLRAEHAALSRRRILDAAARLFRERGYLGTTLAAVAAEAEVSVQTVYNVVGGKGVLLKEVYDVTIAGDDDPVPISQRPFMRAVMEAPTARECLQCYAAAARMLGERTLPLLRVLLAQAASGDPDLQAFAETIEGERAGGTGATARHVAERFGLRPDLDEQSAADILWAFTAPDLAERLVHRRGWGWDRYQEWLGTTMAEALLGPQPSSG